MITNLTADTILAISEADPERLFSAPDKIKSEYRDLIKKWHPDANRIDPKASDVTAHITLLFSLAEQKVANGVWHTPGVLSFKGINGKKWNARYRKKHQFELGNLYYGDSVIIYVLRNEFADLFENSRKMIERINYRDEEMRKEFERYMPKPRARFETINREMVLVLEKPKEAYLLRDIMNVMTPVVDPKHVAWILNTIYNICCFLEFNKITHNAISPDTFFVSPKTHQGFLFGGWWYAKNIGHRLNVLPTRSHAIAPTSILNSKEADTKLDLMLVRAMGREMLGDITGMTFNKSTVAPKPMLDFLRQASIGYAVSDYTEWNKRVLPESFGARRFVEMSVSSSDIFKE